MQLNLTKHNHYDGLKTVADPGDWILFGAPYDGTSSYRSGSRFAPAAIRTETRLCQESYSSYFDVELETLAIADLGDLELPFGDRDGALHLIRLTADRIFENNHRPFMIGGEHLVTLPVVASALDTYPDLMIIQIDAHADMAEEVFGETISHGTVMRRITDRTGAGRLIQIGIRSGTRDELRTARSLNTVYASFPRDSDWLKSIDDRPVYLTIDLDGFDPSQIPGTGTPETGGLWFADFILFLKQIQSLNIIGIDVNELAPRLDSSNMSTIFAAKVIRETIAACVHAH